MATVRPPKRRRTGKHLPPMVEGSDAAMDTAIYIQSESGQRILIPVRPNTPEQINPVTDPDHSNTSLPEPDPDINADFGEEADIEIHIDHHRPLPRNRWFYMKEFVARIDEVLQAIQAREALPVPNVCAECSESGAIWRCDDCVGAKLLCRFCMRHSHSSNPFHRIECWTGTHFRKAAL